ncbi:DUF6479 family protein [uncultured Streptomyces sp.]|uniref:DUF6479 family protein n=1 Tax=uncultured Streptomyces sp. TaxID=174707 RepID=UPI002612BF3E|nr:DUF6479 family protein [uncultured Streptomyces sp.]
MDVTNGAQVLSAATLADGPGAVGVVMAVAGVAVVALLIGAFWLGMRRKDKELPPPRPDEQPVPPAHRTHVQQHDVHGSDEFPDDRKGLSPYELGDRGNEKLPPESDRPRD